MRREALLLPGSSDQPGGLRAGQCARPGQHGGAGVHGGVGSQLRAGAGVERPDGALGAPAAGPDPVQLDLFLARLAADGLWLFEATRPAPLAPEVKEALVRRIAALTEPPA
jgi:hypothetical protein